jgi:hypothetical protein
MSLVLNLTIKHLDYAFSPHNENGKFLSKTINKRDRTTTEAA